MAFALVEAVCIVAVLGYPSLLFLAFSTGCIVPGEVPATSEGDPGFVVLVAFMLLAVIAVVSVVLAYRMSLAKPPAKSRLSAALKAQGWLALLVIVAFVAVYDPHRVYHCG
ncbi:hypothetical protein ABZZ47_35375 [Streptomyces sp. NPDC006465]|uniref:hypothetical protein n=1 Tax=Streptomyces sp. NPDC006465 TaxID=3157174 RepID=UPI0033BCA0E5